MASSSTRKQCAHDDVCKQTAVTNCEGCSKAFCIKHFTDHRRLLERQMNVIIDEHDHFKYSLSQQMTTPDSGPLVKEIDSWERESITKIRRRATELRQELLQMTTTNSNDLSKKLEELSNKLKESRESDSFIEADLYDWKKTLDNLKTNLTSPSTISVSQSDNVLLVQNISLTLFKFSHDYFDSVFNNAVNITDKGQVAVRDSSEDSTEVRGKNEYEHGCHGITLRIEQFNGGWIFFGINSKETPLQRCSYLAISAYGWSSNNYVWLSGISQGNNLCAPVEMKLNDIVSLIFDCDNRQISITNERTKAKHQLNVDINNCRFPWQLHIVLYEPNTRVRLLS